MVRAHALIVVRVAILIVREPTLLSMAMERVPTLMVRVRVPTLIEKVPMLMVRMPALIPCDAADHY